MDCSVLTTEDTSSLPVPETKFNGPEGKVGAVSCNHRRGSQQNKQTIRTIRSDQDYMHGIAPEILKETWNKLVCHLRMCLTSVICKVLESIVRYHMVDFLSNYKLRNTSQHEFLKARSGLTNLICFSEKKLNGWMKGYQLI